MYTVCLCVHDLQWFPSGRCYCRNKANSLTDRGGPEAVCPSAEHKNSLRERKEGETGQLTEIHLLSEIISRIQDVDS